MPSVKSRTVLTSAAPKDCRSFPAGTGLPGLVPRTASRHPARPRPYQQDTLGERLAHQSLAMAPSERRQRRFLPPRRAPAAEIRHLAQAAEQDGERLPP